MRALALGALLSFAAAVQGQPLLTKISATTQASRDTDALTILRRELADETQAEQNATDSLDRARHAENTAALKREVARLLQRPAGAPPESQPVAVTAARKQGVPAQTYVPPDLSPQIAIRAKSGAQPESLPAP